jgi:fluoride exporter
MKNILYVFLGSGLGGTFRYALSLLMPQIYAGKFPLSTFISNIIACFILGITVGAIEHKISNVAFFRLFVIIGICGGFSTFSSLSFEMIRLTEQREFAVSLFYIIASFLCSIILIYAGISLGNKLA